MSHKKVTAQGAPFNLLVGTHPYGSQPNTNVNAPFVRKTVTTQVIQTDKDAVNTNARMGLSGWGIDTPAYGSLTVLDNDFSTGEVIIQLGNYQLISYIDFQPGVSVNATATAIASAISRLPGYSANAGGAVVVVIYDVGTADQIEFTVLQLGSKVNLGNLTPNNGLLAVGSPCVQPPIIG
jgi:hypothetical protein